MWRCLHLGLKHVYDSLQATSWVVDNFKPAVEAFNKEHEQSDSKYHITMDYTTERLCEQSATYAAGYDAVCLFVNDSANAATIKTLSALGVKMIANRCAGFDRVDTKAALAYNITLARVPAYSPYAVAEFAISLLMGVNRKIARASARVKMANFSLDAGLMGIDVHGKTVGVMGTGKIGQILCEIIKGFGAKLICYDVYEADVIKQMGGTYVTQDEIYAQSDILFLMSKYIPYIYGGYPVRGGPLDSSYHYAKPLVDTYPLICCDLKSFPATFSQCPSFHPLTILSMKVCWIS